MPREIWKGPRDMIVTGVMATGQIGTMTGTMITGAGKIATEMLVTATKTKAGATITDQIIQIKTGVTNIMEAITPTMVETMEVPETIKAPTGTIGKTRAGEPMIIMVTGMATIDAIAILTMTQEEVITAVEISTVAIPATLATPTRVE